MKIKTRKKISYMKNREIAKIFYQIADFLEMEDVAFKPTAYRKAAFSLDILEKDIEEIYKEGGEKAIEAIQGFGKSLAVKAIEYLKTGKIKYYQDYKKKYPIDIESLTSIEGIGPKAVKELYKRLKIKNLSDLERAAREGKIRNLPNFGPKTEKNILQGIEFVKKSKGRFLLGDILPKARKIEKRLKALNGIAKVDVCGSVRRRKETIGDIDFLISLKPSFKEKSARYRKKAGEIMDTFCSLPGVFKVWGKGLTKSSIRMEEGFDIDLRVVPFKSYGAALQYFTGNKQHNILLRRLAMDKGLKLNEYGLFRGSRKIAGENEEDIYKKLGLAYPPPEIRTNRGEIEAAAKSKLPNLIKLRDIKGDLHCHSVWDGGENTIREMAEAAMALNYKYLGISDHTKFLRIENGLNEKQLSEQRKEIDKLNEGFKKQKLGFRLLQGCEANILNDGSLDIRDSALKKLDYVVAGVHSNLKMPKGKMTERIIKAMKNPYVKIISHPTGRLLNKREGYQIDLGKILRAARETKTALEINAFPIRLDLNDINTRKAIGTGVKLSIDSDAHHKEHLKMMEYGLATARRGWAEKKDIINTWPLQKLLKFFNS